MSEQEPVKRKRGRPMKRRHDALVATAVVPLVTPEAPEPISTHLRRLRAVVKRIAMNPRVVLVDVGGEVGRMLVRDNGKWHVGMECEVEEVRGEVMCWRSVRGDPRHRGRW